MTSNGNIIFQGSWSGDISKSVCGGGEEEKIGSVGKTDHLGSLSHINADTLHLNSNVNPLRVFSQGKLLRFFKREYF